MSVPNKIDGVAGCTAIIDTGFRAIPELGAARTWYADFTGGAAEPPCYSGNFPSDDGLHGTQAAVCIDLLARQPAVATDAAVELLLCRVAASGWTADFDRDVANAIRFAVRRGATVIYFGWISYQPLLLVDRAIAEFADRALFVAPAGNHTGNIDDNPVYPASLEHPNLLVVTHERLATLGPRGDDVGFGHRNVDVVAMGAEPFLSFDGSRHWFGDTSGAAAAVAGLATRLSRTNPQGAPAELNQTLLGMVEEPDDEHLSDMLRTCTVSGGYLRIDSTA